MKIVLIVPTILVVIMGSMMLWGEKILSGIGLLLVLGFVAYIKWLKGHGPEHKYKMSC